MCKFGYLIFFKGKNSIYSVGDRNFPIKKNQTLEIIAFPEKKSPLSRGTTVLIFLVKTNIRQVCLRQACKRGGTSCFNLYETPKIRELCKKSCSNFFLKQQQKVQKKLLFWNFFLHVSFLLILLVAVFKSDLSADSQSFLTFFCFVFFRWLKNVGCCWDR